MKTTLSIIIIVTVMILIVACTSENPFDTEVVVVRDITELHLSQPKSVEINALFDLDKDKWKGALFHFVDITDVSYNRTYEASIEGENQCLSNEFERRKKVEGFYTDISKILTGSEKDSIGRDNSSVYAPIARELNSLHKSTASKRILLLYSDLMENTTGMSFYNGQKLGLLKTNPDSISKYFETLVPLENLKGIKIYIIFQPDGIGHDEQFKIVSGFYKRLFEAKGAVVQIAANLN